jgi:hypothetical protein
VAGGQRERYGGFSPERKAMSYSQRLQRAGEGLITQELLRLTAEQRAESGNGRAPTEAAGSELPFEEREIVVRADFDELDDERCLWASFHFLRGPRHPRAGEWVYLLDGCGRGCLGRVEAVRGWIARVKPDWATLMEGRPDGKPALKQS